MKFFSKNYFYGNLIFITVLLTPAITFGQITFDGCFDIRGAPVASIASPVNDVAKAGLGPTGNPVIYYNPNVLRWMAPETRLFWYGHECAHHALGHLFGSAHPLHAEQQADCWGINTLVEEGYLRESDLPVIQKDLSPSPGDWTHLPGPQRAINLARCLGIDSNGEDHIPPPPPPPATMCYTNMGSCFMSVPIPIGSSCGCPSQFGIIPGIAG